MKALETFTRAVHNAITYVNGGQNVFVVNDSPAKTDEYDEWLAAHEEEDEPGMAEVDQALRDIYAPGNVTPLPFDLEDESSYPVNDEDLTDDQVAHLVGTYEPENISDVEQDRDNNGLDDFEPSPFQEESTEPNYFQKFQEYLAGYENEPFSVNGVVGDESVPLDINDSNVYQYAKLVTKAVTMAKQEVEANEFHRELTRSLVSALNEQLDDMLEENRELHSIIDSHQEMVSGMRTEFDRSIQQSLNREKKVQNRLYLEQSAISEFLEKLDEAAMLSYPRLFGGYHLDPEMRDIVDGAGPLEKYLVIFNRLQAEMN